MYYEKVVGLRSASGRGIQPDYPDAGLDIQPKIDEYRIVGPTGGNAGISTITASGTTVTIGLSEALTGLDTNTPIVIDGITASGYDGKYVVSEVVNSLTFKYKVQNPPTDTSPSSGSATVSTSTDTVTSASPYIFNISLRSVFGMCGCTLMVLLQLDLSQWLLHSLLVLVCRRTIMHSYCMIVLMESGIVLHKDWRT